MVSKKREIYVKLASILEEAFMISVIDNNRRENKKVDFYNIDSRCKEVSSYRDKLQSKNYSDDFPADKMDDLVGARIIGYSKYDVDNAVEIIEKNKNFKHKIDDKQSELGANEIGYQSIHITASFCPDSNFITPEEYDTFKDICFEIQVRTVLQEAWAALNHKKSYKFKGYLPEKIKRKLDLFSAVFELLDDE